MKVFPAVVSLMSADVLVGMSKMVASAVNVGDFANDGRRLNHDDETSWRYGLDEGDWGIKGDIYPDDNGDSNPDSDRGFGWQVDITDDSKTIIVGSYNSGLDGCCVSRVTETDPNDPTNTWESCVDDVDAAGTGSARVFVRSTNIDGSVDWTQQGFLIGNDGAGGKYAGYTVDIDGDTAVVAAVQLPCHYGHVRVFIFVRDASGSWSQQAMLHDEYDNDNSSGTSYHDDGRVPRVALQGDVAVVGRPTAGNVDYVLTGSAIVYVRSGTTWNEGAILEPSNSAGGDFFGADVDIDGDVILVGATQQNKFEWDQNGNDLGVPRKGKAYVFRGSGASWSEEAILLPGDDVSDQFMFGSSVSVDAGTAVIGHGKDWSFGDDEVTAEDGVIYAHVFIDAGSGSWPLQTKLFHPNVDDEGNARDQVWGRFGSVVDVKGDLAIVGDGWPSDVMLYERTGTTWAVKQILSSISGWSDQNTYHGNSRKLALTSDTALMAVDRGYQTSRRFNDNRQEGSAAVFDNFSFLPLGPWEVKNEFNFIDAYAGIMVTVFLFGIGRNYEVEIFQEDCQTPISDLGINLQHENDGMVNLTHGWIQQVYGFDNSTSTITNSSIFNADTWEIKICSQMKLVSDAGTIEAEDEKIYSQFVDLSRSATRPPGPWEISYNSVRNWNIAIHLWYQVGFGRDSEVELLQKDCQTPITDTEITVSLSTFPINFTHNALNPVYTFNSTTVASSSIFNADTSQLEICSRVKLVSESGTVEAEDTQVLFLDVVERGNGLVTGINGDPHIVSWDGLKFDCQAAGEFITVTSLEDPTFKIQERFSEASSNAGAQATVSTGVAVKDLSKPVIQVSIPKTGQSASNMVGGCPIDFYVNGTASTFGIDLSSSNVLVKVVNERITIEHTDTSLSVDVTVQTSDTFGCLFMVEIYLPATFRSGETILGLLGTPNGDSSDEWRRPNGTTISAPSTEDEKIFGTAYDYCVENWCIDISANSMFTYGTGESFADISKCDLPYDPTIENLVKNPPPALAAVCGNNLACIVDGTHGNISDASQAIQNEAAIVQAQAIAQSLPANVTGTWPTSTATTSTATTTTSTATTTTSTAANTTSTATTTTSTAANTTSTATTTTPTGTSAATSSTTSSTVAVGVLGGCYEAYSTSKSYTIGDYASSTITVTSNPEYTLDSVTGAWKTKTETTTTKNNYKCISSVWCDKAGYSPGDAGESLAWKKESKECSGIAIPAVAPVRPLWAGVGCPRPYEEGNVYDAADVVSVDGSVYQCAAVPTNLFCGMKGYSPGNDQYWSSAWSVLGSCDGTLAPTSSPNFVVLTNVGGCPKEWEANGVQATGDAYEEGDMVSSGGLVFKCKPWPYSGHCSQAGYEPSTNPGAWKDAWFVSGYCEGSIAPTNAPTGYSGVCEYTKCTTSTSAETCNSGDTGCTCAGSLCMKMIKKETCDLKDVETWSKSIDYVTGDVVRIGNKRFKCREWPFYFWCRMEAYEPTMDDDDIWKNAWRLDGTCS